MNHSISSVKNIEKCPGFGFFPSDERLIDTFVTEKNSGQVKDNWPILEIDLCDFEPWDLLALLTAGCDNYRYFFYKRHYANGRNKSYKRRTKTGYWKSTGKPRKIKGESTKRSLSFYRKCSIRGSKEIRTGWIMQEYDNGGQYVIGKLQIKDDNTKKRKLRCQNDPLGDSTEKNQIGDSTEKNQTIYHNSEVQNVSTDDSAEDNQIDSHYSEGLSGFEDQNQKEITVMTNHNKGETICPMASVYYKNSSSTESGGEYQSPDLSSDLEMTANYTASQDYEGVSSHFDDQNGQDMNTDKAICLEGFSGETENQISNKESEGEWSPTTASPYNSFPNETIFGGEGKIFSPYNSLDWSLHNDPEDTNFDLGDWWNNPHF